MRSTRWACCRCCARRTGSIRRIHASRAGDFGRIRLEASAHGREEFGQVVVARDFGEALDARLASLRHLTRYRPARFIGLGEDRNGLRHVRITEGDGERDIGTRLLVAADGTRSGVRNALGLRAREHDYGQTLLVARLRTQRPPDGTAYERLTSSGPTALLPRGDGHYGLVHGVASDETAAVARWTMWRSWHAAGAFGWRAGRFLSSVRAALSDHGCVADALVAPRQCWSATARRPCIRSVRRASTTGPRCADLAEFIAAHPDDAGDASVLRQHAARRGRRRTRTLASRMGWRNSPRRHAPAAPLRSAGLMAGDAMGCCRLAVGGAMGYRGDVPALCRKVASA